MAKPTTKTPTQPTASGSGVKDALAMFGNVPTVAKVNKPAAKAGKDREEVELGPELDSLAAFKVMEKVLGEEGGLLQKAVRNRVVEMFRERMIKDGKKPDNFLGVGERSSASCEIRRRGSDIPLDADTAAALESKGIPVDKKVKVPERLILNPELDQTTLMRLAELVKKDPVLKNQVVVMRQEEEYNYIVAESTMDMLAKSGDLELVQQMLEKLATFAVGKFKLDGLDIEAGEKEKKKVTPEAKAAALQILQDMGVLPAPEAPALPAPKKRVTAKEAR
jgi:hypothetical protein